jgi:hypothetical protein
MPGDDGLEGPEKAPQRSDQGGFRNIVDSDYVKALDEIDPGFAERILTLVEVQQRFEQKRTGWALTLRLARIIAIVVGMGVLIGIGVYLIKSGESVAAQTVFLTVNAAFLVIATTSWWETFRTQKKREGANSRSRKPLE